MEAVFALLMTFLVVTVRADIARNTPLSFGNFVRMNGYVLRGNPLLSLSESEGRDVSGTCAFSCIETPGCESYNIGTEQKNCSLMSTDHFKNASDLEALQSHDYYYRAVSTILSVCV